jgi:lipopolysaccharide/colanic/teichoic acid biosynthesis glycosyltransferase
MAPRNAIALGPALPARRVRVAPRLRRSYLWYERTHAPWLGHAAYERWKRAIDVVVCLLALPVATPLILLSALAITLDTPGPALMIQQRTGKGGRRFGMFKLRTMVRNAHELKAQYMHLNEHTYPDFKITNDPRVTRCGRILRKLSFDELPQLFNVIRGDMTLVGPRPTSFDASTYQLWHTARLEVRPGLTGLWQIGGRADVDFDERLRLDVAYIANRCLWLDLRILVRTFTAVLSGRGAN